MGKSWIDNKEDRAGEQESFLAVEDQENCLGKVLRRKRDLQQPLNDG